MTAGGMNISNTRRQGKGDPVGDVKRFWGAAIRRQRKVVGLTQAQLAKAVQVDQSSVSFWEKGQKAPSVEHQLAIAKALRVDPHVLFQFPRAA